MAASNFSAVLAETLKWEGGTVDDKRDRGGRTKAGVTQATDDAWRRARGLPVHDVFAMDSRERNAIYRERFWTAIGGDDLREGVDLAAFDYGVNSGPARALRALGRTSSVADPADAVKTICAIRLSFLRSLHRSVFEKGWMRRVAGIEAVGVAMALKARIGAAPNAPPSDGVRLQLSVQGQRAAIKARSHARAAQATLAAGAGGSGSQLAGPVSLHLPWPVVAALLLVAGAGVALLLWRQLLHKARAEAYAALAAIPVET